MIRQKRYVIIIIFLLKNITLRMFKKETIYKKLDAIMQQNTQIIDEIRKMNELLKEHMKSSSSSGNIKI